MKSCWFQVILCLRSLKGEGGGRRTCREEEHRYGPVVLPLCAPAEGDQRHQEGHQSGHGARDQQHEGGNLPVCKTRTRSGQSSAAQFNQSAVLANTKQELIPQSEVICHVSLVSHDRPEAKQQERLTCLHVKAEKDKITRLKCC